MGLAVTPELQDPHSRADTSPSSLNLTLTPDLHPPLLQHTHQESPIWLPVTLFSSDSEIHTNALLDSGASSNFINHEIVLQYNIVTIALNRQIKVELANGQQSIMVTHATVPLRMSIDTHVEITQFYVTDLKTYPVILGISWLKQHNPIIHWSPSLVILKSGHCRHHCGIDSSLVIRGMDKPRMISFASMAHSVDPGTSQIPDKYEDFADVFSKQTADTLPESRPGLDCEIRLKENQELPSVKPIYRLSEPESLGLRKYLDEMLAKRFIRPSTSSIAAPIFFVSKPGGGFRPCVDYRTLNNITVKDKYPIPIMDTLIDQLSRAHIFSKIDLRTAYNQVRIAEGHEWKTSFRCRYGQYEYLVMPFGLTNAPSIFMKLINSIFSDMIDHYVVIYLDDILIFSRSQEEHNRHVRNVLQRLREHRLFAKLEKCEFDLTSVEFCGLVVSQDGIHMAPIKTKAVDEWPTPTTLKALQSFLGFINFYRRFIPAFAKIALPLTALTRKDVPFVWSPECDSAFTSLKSLVTSSPVLRIPNPSLPFVVETDASDFALGAVLSQQDPVTAKFHPCAYRSQKLSGAELNYSANDKELLAIVRAFEDWRHYLLGSSNISIRCDHKNLVYFKSRQHLTPRHARWAMSLSDYPFTIDHISGTSNAAADALSRRNDHFPVEEERRERLERTILAIIEIKEKTAQRAIISARHDSPSAGHFGVAKTMHNIQRDFSWAGMKKMVKHHIKTCIVCQQNKASRHKPYGLLQPLPVPDSRWVSVTMDFIVKLPKSQGHDSILVVVDRATKMAHFVPCSESITSRETAELFINNVFKLHGLPQQVISDRGPQFRSQFWKQLLEILEIKVSLSTAYHPETDGQTERVNQVLEQYLRCFISYEQNNWVQFLPLAEFAYNNSFHQSTGTTPFYANYAFHPRSDLLTNGKPSSNNPVANDYSEALNAIFDNVQKHLTKAQEDYRTYANQLRQHHQFQIGDQVWLLTKNISTTRPNRKLDYKRIGPFRIKEQINNVTFNLDLPDHMHIHPVFHVSLLEPYHAPDQRPNIVQPPPILTDPDGDFYMIDYIVDVRTPSTSPNRRWEWLVHWFGYSEADRTWEPASHFENTIDTLFDFYQTNGLHKSQPQNLTRLVFGKNYKPTRKGG
jgi:hypothetical protein